MHRQRRIIVEGEELASVRERCTGIEQTFDNLQVFLEAGNTHRGTVICQPSLGVFVSGPAGADAKLEPSAGQRLDRGRFLGEEGGRAEVLVEHVGGQPDFASGDGGSHQRGECRQAAQMIRDHEARVAGVLRAAGERQPLVRIVDPRGLESEAKWPHLTRANF